MRQTIISTIGNGNIIINGKHYQGNVKIVDGKIITDNETIDINEKIINITVEGNVDKIETEIGNITVNGNAHSISTVNGDVDVTQDVGNVSTVNGNVTAQNITNATTINGNIH